MGLNPGVNWLGSTGRARYEYPSVKAKNPPEVNWSSLSLHDGLNQGYSRYSKPLYRSSGQLVQGQLADIFLVGNSRPYPDPNHGDVQL